MWRVTTSTIARLRGQRLTQISSRRLSFFESLTEFLPGHASVALQPRCKVGQHRLSISPGHGLAPNATVTAEVTPPPSVEMQPCIIQKAHIPPSVQLLPENSVCFSFVPAPPAAVRGSRGASRHPQHPAYPPLHYPHQESGRGPNHYAGRNHRHHRHHRPVSTQGGTEPRYVMERANDNESVQGNLGNHE